MDSDSALLARYARRGCPDSFRELVYRYAPMALSVARRVTGDADLAQDVAQESFFELSKHAGNVEGSLAAWMHRVVLSRAIDQRRKTATRREKELAAIDTAASRGGPGVPESVSWRETESLIDAALERLPDEECIALILHYIQGRSQPEIAAALGVDQSTVSRRISRGLALLRDELRKLGVESEDAALAGVLVPAVVTPQQIALLAKAAGKMSLAAAGHGASAVISRAALTKAAVVVGAGLGTVVIVFVIIMAVLLLGRARTTSRRIVCATNLKAACQAIAIYASQNSDQLPDAAPFDGTWLCDVPPRFGDMLNTVITGTMHVPGPDPQRLLYCPENTGQDMAKLWTPAGDHRVLGYVWFNERSATSGGMPTLAGLRASPPLDYHARFIGTPMASQTELALDWIISDTSSDGPGTKWTGIVRDASSPPYSTSHISQNRPEGANIVCFDGHVEYRKFSAARATSVQQGGGGTAPSFWIPKP